MNIQFADEYINAEKGETPGAWGFGKLELGLETEKELELGPELGRWSRSRGPNSEDGLESEPGPQRRRVQ